MTDFIWFFRVEVRALTGKSQPLIEGSMAQLQCFVPAPTLEGALPRLDEFLKSESFERVSVRVAHRFEADAPREDVDSDLISKGIQRVVSTGLPSRGVMITADETSLWKTREKGREDESKRGPN